jgi:lipopolysaccharide transport system ATP-binding protein
MSEIAICLTDVSKCFKRYEHPADRLKEILQPRKIRSEEFWALRDITLEIPQGQTVGIVGRNGSGKSTLLQIIAGTLTPTTGIVKVKNRISALLELGSGFNPEFTGRQNVFFNGRLLGLTQKEIEDKFDEIAGFADIGDFIEQPVKTYSSGMFVRLAFAVAVSVNPEILIVDEALAVGDVVFQHRCMRRMRSLMDSGVTTLFVSHDSGAIKTLCNSAIMIHDGQLYTSGTPNAVIIEYLKLVTELELSLSHPVDASSAVAEPANLESAMPNVEELMISGVTNSIDGQFMETALPEQVARRGSGKARIEAVKLLNSQGEDLGESPVFGFNEEITLTIALNVYARLQACIIGFYICDKNGNEVIGSNTFEENAPIGSVEAGGSLQVQFKFKLPLRPSSYSLTVAGAESHEGISFDWLDNVIVFQVLPPDSGKRVYALVDQPMTVDVSMATPQKMLC